DRGWHYRTPDWVRACGEAGVERSMSRKGHSPDNAACEGFFGRLKVEFFHGRDWRGVSAERFAAELAEWIRWYREGRLKAFDEGGRKVYDTIAGRRRRLGRSEEHTSELQSRFDLVCRLLLEKKKIQIELVFS